MTSLVGFLLGLLFWFAGLMTLIPGFVAWVERANSPEADTEKLAPHLAGVVGVLWEWGCSLVLFLSQAAGWFDFDPYPDERDSHDPVLLVHGYGMNRGAWLLFRQRLRARGYRNVFTINLPFFNGDIRQYADHLHARIEGLAQFLPERRWVLVGHSMGGLVIRQYLRQHGSERLARAYTIGSPHRGTKLAFVGLGRQAGQMMPRSSFIAAINADRETAEPVDRITCLASSFDNMVIPWESAVLDPERAMIFRYLGHNALLLSSEVFESLVEDLEQVPQAA